MSQALCRATDPDQLFVRGAAQRKAAVICRHCPVIAECGADALDNRVEFGVWGGMTERQRRALLKQHPQPTQEQVLSLMNGSLCRCNGYPKILRAIHRAAGQIES